MHQKVYAVSSWLWPECIQNLNGDSDQKCFLMVEWKSPTNSRVFPASPQNQVEPKLLWILLLTAARAPYLVLAPQSIEPGQGQLTSPAVEASSSSHDSCGGGSPCDALIRWKKNVGPGENADRAHIIPLSIAHRSAYSPRMSKVSSELGAMREELPGTCFLRWCNWQSQQVAAASTEQQQNVFRLHIVVSSFTSDQVRLRKSGDPSRFPAPLSARSLGLSCCDFAVWVQTLWTWLLLVYYLATKTSVESLLCMKARADPTCLTTAAKPAMRTPIIQSISQNPA